MPTLKFLARKSSCRLCTEAPAGRAQLPNHFNRTDRLFTLKNVLKRFSGRTISGKSVPHGLQIPALTSLCYDTGDCTVLGVNVCSFLLLLPPPPHCIVGCGRFLFPLGLRAGVLVSFPPLAPCFCLCHDCLRSSAESESACERASGVMWPMSHPHLTLTSAADWAQHPGVSRSVWKRLGKA